ncbi:MAG: class I SAM-dependent methyltransferase [Pseudomonadota bacterium]
MTEDAYWQDFFKLHRGLPREGPGLPEDVAWAAATAGVVPTARILDAACGPGADLAALRAAAPEGHIRAVEKVAQFAEAARKRAGSDPRVAVATGDMMAETGPFDFIWCAGAVYFPGVRGALEGWRAALAPGGAIAFSQVCWFTKNASVRAHGFWANYGDMTDEAGVAAQIGAAGYSILGKRRLSDAAWEAYYTPLDAAVLALRSTETGTMATVLDQAEEEADVWRGDRDNFGYTLFVVHPA